MKYMFELNSTTGYHFHGNYELFFFQEELDKAVHDHDELNGTKVLSLVLILFEK